MKPPNKRLHFHMLNIKSNNSIQFKNKPKVLFCIEDRNYISKYEMYSHYIINYKFDLMCLQDNVNNNYEQYDVILHYHLKSYEAIPENKICICFKSNSSNKKDYDKYDKVIISSLREFESSEALKVNNCVQIFEPININVFGCDKKWNKRSIDALVLTDNHEDLGVYEDRNISIYKYENIYSEERLNQVFNNCKIVVLIDDTYLEQAFKAAACGCLVINNSEYLNNVNFFNHCKIHDGLNLIKKMLDDKNSINNSIINSKLMLKYDVVYHCKQINKIIDELIVKKQGHYLI